MLYKKCICNQFSYNEICKLENFHTEAMNAHDAPTMNYHLCSSYIAEEEAEDKGSTMLRTTVGGQTRLRMKRCMLKNQKKDFEI